MQRNKLSSPKSTSPDGSNHILDDMSAHGLPITRESHLDLNFPEGVPDTIPAEMEIPRTFRRQ